MTTDQALIKINLKNELKGDKKVRVELGCGTKKTPGYLTIDRLDLPNVDIVADLEKGLPFFPDNSVDEIVSTSFFEHLENLHFLMKEIWRVLKPTGRNRFFVPHFSNPYYYSDYTHRTFFGLYSFEYFSTRQTRFQRKVPEFYHDFGFETESLFLEFRSQWLAVRLLRSLVGKIINSSPALQEFYEDNLCYLVPCYGMHIVQKPVKK